MRLRLLAALFISVVPALSLAQPAQNAAGCDTYGLQNFELALRLDNDFNVPIRVYDVETGALVDSYTATFGYEVPGSSGCHWIAYVGEPETPSTGVFVLDRATLYRIDFGGGPSRSFYYYLPSDFSTAGENIFTPRGGTGPQPDILFIRDFEGLRVYPTALGAGASGRDVDDFFSGDWVLPYDVPTICSDNTYGLGCDIEDDQDYPFLATTPYSTSAPTSSSIELVTSGSKDWRVPGGTNARSYSWSSTDVSEIRFERGIRIQGTLDVSGIGFAKAASAGWFGIQYLPGSTGTLDGVTVEGVGRSAGGRHSVMVQSADVDVVNSLIRDAECCDAAGVRVTGQTSDALVTGTAIREMTGAGVLASGAGLARLIANRIQRNDGDGVIATNDARIRLYTPTSGPQSAMSNEVDINEGWGVRALTSAIVEHTVGGQQAATKLNGYSYIHNNDGGGGESRTGSFHDAGFYGDYAADNWFQNNGASNGYYYDGIGPDAAAKGTGTDFYARYSYWGRPTNPDTLSVDGALLRVDPMLSGPPASPSAQRQAGADSSGPVNLARFEDGSVDADPMVAVADALGAGEGALAVGMLETVVASQAGRPGAAAALRTAAYVATDERYAEPTRNAARALLRREANGIRVEHKIWAQRGILHVAARTGDLAGALGAADVLVSSEADPTSRLLGYLGRAYALAQTGEADGAWAAWQEAALIASTDDWVALMAAREDVADLTETLPRTWPRQGREFAEAQFTPQAVGLDAPYPNPAHRAPTAVSYRLVEPGHVRLSVFDVLGREVVVVADGPHEEGEHVAVLDTSPFTPGAYVVRLTVRGSASYTRVLTVTR